jgi:hypothetical protein
MRTTITEPHKSSLGMKHHLSLTTDKQNFRGKPMKKLLAITLALLLAFSLAACSGKDNKGGNNPTNPPASQDESGNNSNSSSPTTSQDNSSKPGGENTTGGLVPNVALLNFWVPASESSSYHFVRENSPGVYIKLGGEKLPENVTTAQEYAVFKQNQLNSANPAAFSDIETVALTGEVVKGAAYTMTPENGGSKSRFVYIVKDSFAFTLECTSPVNTFVQYMVSDFQPMIDSFAVHE